MIIQIQLVEALYSYSDYLCPLPLSSNIERWKSLVKCQYCSISIAMVLL